MQAHQAFHLLHGSCRCIGAQEGVVAFAVLVDFIGHRFDTPILAVHEFPAVVGQDSAEMFDQAFGLCIGQVLACDHDMLI